MHGGSPVTLRHCSYLFDTRGDAGCAAGPFSPDGRLILSTAELADVARLVIAGPQGGSPRILPSLPGLYDVVDWFPDGRDLLPKCGFPRVTLCVVDRRGRRVPRLEHDLPTDVDGGRISPDGRWLAYLSTEGDVELARLGHRGTRMLASNGGSTDTGYLMPSWQPLPR